MDTALWASCVPLLNNRFNKSSNSVPSYVSLEQRLTHTAHTHTLGFLSILVCWCPILYYLHGTTLRLSPLRPPLLVRCSRTADEAVTKATKDHFWHDKIIKKAHIQSSIRLTMADLKGQVDARVKFSEGAKRVLAETLETYLEGTFHRLHLLSQHRGSQTPNHKDWNLSEILGSPAAFQAGNTNLCHPHTFPRWVCISNFPKILTS